MERCSGPLTHAITLFEGRVLRCTYAPPTLAHPSTLLPCLPRPLPLLPQRAAGSLLRPPALVCEYMGGGSLKSAISRRADIVAGVLTRVVLALDAAKVG